MAGALTIDTLNNSAGVFAANNAFSGVAKAWVNFDGTNGTIRSSLNVSSVTIVAVSQMQVNFATPMPSANYAISVAGQGGGATGGFGSITNGVAPTANNVTVASVYTSTASLAYANSQLMCVVVFA